MSELFQNMLKQEEKERNQRNNSSIQQPIETEKVINKIKEESVKKKIVIDIFAKKENPNNDLFTKKASRMQPEVKKKETVKIEELENEIKSTSKRRTKAQIEEEKVLLSNDAEELFKLSGTHPNFKSQWISHFEKARKSGRNGPILDKFKRGKFYINETGGLNILPELETRDKSVNELLSTKWI